MVFENVLQIIGNTPIVRLNKVAQGLSAELYAKLEFTNPGGSIKDRIGWWMIEDAEKRGHIKPGGTVIECTSGNTGMGLAIAAAVKGYKCIFVLPDKMSTEKIQNLRAFGAKVIVTPTAVAPDDPKSFYSVARRLARETPNSVHLNQYDNLSNREAHYKTTGPEILKQMPDIDVLVGGMGTGGTICGVGKYLKEHRPSAKIVAVDPVGSIVYDYFKTGKMETIPKSYKIEGIGEDFIPKNFDFSVIDDMVQIEDKESFIATRELLTKEGIYTGCSAAGAMVGAIKYIKANSEKLRGKKVLVIFPDSGNRYLSKVFNDDWMRETGFLDDESMGTVSDLLESSPSRHGNVIMVQQSQNLSTVIETLHDKNISQVPVIDKAGWIKGIVTEGALLSALYSGKMKPSDNIEPLVDASVEFVTLQDPIEKVSRLVTSGKTVLVNNPEKSGEMLGIITKIDLLAYLGKRT